MFKFDYQVEVDPRENKAIKITCNLGYEEPEFEAGLKRSSSESGI
ncbi:hypothetical protein [Paenibacillus hubeiensis]